MKTLRNPPLYPRNPLRHMDHAARFNYVTRALMFLAFAIGVLLIGGVALKYATPGLVWKFTPPRLSSTAAHYRHVRVVGAKTGINSETGSAPPRLELSEFMNSAEGVDLYLQCHLELLNKNASDKLSFYQIAGVNYLVCWISWSSPLTFEQPSTEAPTRLGMG